MNVERENTRIRQPFCVDRITTKEVTIVFVFVVPRLKRSKKTSRGRLETESKVETTSLICNTVAELIFDAIKLALRLTATEQ